MANRYVAFGYEIMDGVINIIPKEAEVVRNIYALYIQGLSLLDITNRLNMLTISYANDGRPWNKNIVKRILENKKYTGEDGYPQVISEETARLALECKEKKYTHLSEDDKRRVDIYKARGLCGLCGSKIARKHVGAGKKKRMYWNCINTQCAGSNLNFNEKILNTLITEVLNDISQDFTKVEVDITNDYKKEKPIFLAHNEMTEIIDNPNAEINDVIDKILNLATEKFKVCKSGDNTALSTKIKESLALYPKSIVADGKVIEKVIKRIKLHPHKEIIVEFINGKEIEIMEKEIG